MSAEQRKIGTDADEARAVLAILAKRREGREVDETDWCHVFETEGYRRLKKREASMGVAFSDAEFREFVLSEALASQSDDLRASLTQVESLDLDAAVAAAQAYLPASVGIHGTLYPVIKPKPNSFVFELETDPAMFLAVRPNMHRPVLANTLAHELHHWGMAACSPNPEIKRQLADSPQPIQFAFEALSAFGEGLAMLAAAGGPDVHPHAVSTPEDRERWDRDLSNFDHDLRALESFFIDILDGQFKTMQELFKAAMVFMGETQGPWYTVGYEMAQAVESALGRDVLIDCMGDMRKLLRHYNEVAEADSARWSSRLLDRLDVFAPQEG